VFDIYWGLLLVVAFAAMSWSIGAVIGRRASKRMGTATIIGVLVASGIYAVYLRDSILLAKILPFSNLIVIGNWLPLAAAFIAGLAWRMIPGGILRRGWPVVILLAAGAFASFQPLLGRPPQCWNRWDEDGICRQTEEKSCSAACAATILKVHDIPATEQEMAELCLTRSGTMWQGIYRGLKLKTQGTQYDVEVFSGSIDDLRQMTPGALIVAAGLERGGNVDPIYHEQWGWKPGVLHTVLLFEFVENDRVEMADPDVGREQWTVEDLRVLYRGRGMRLVTR
jgi:hypothetical protein